MLEARFNPGSEPFRVPSFVQEWKSHLSLVHFWRRLTPRKPSPFIDRQGNIYTPLKKKGRYIYNIHYKDAA